MVHQGAAWVYHQYSHDPRLLRDEREAQDARRGLWALPEAERVPPWEWRTAERDGQGRSQPAAIVPTSGTVLSSSFACAGKRYCREMTTCAEACFYLTQCGVRSLDDDHDGVPLRRERGSRTTTIMAMAFIGQRAAPWLYCPTCFLATSPDTVPSQAAPGG